MRKYWASRPNREQLPFFWSEIKEGRLRQGWGYAADQDLALVERTPWDRRTSSQQDTQRQRHMLGGEWGWNEGDIVLVPNMPWPGRFALVRIIGPYRFEISTAHDDYGHIRPVELLTPDGVDNSSTLVDAAIRSTLRVVSRTWSIDHLQSSIDGLLEHIEDPQLLTPSSEKQRSKEAFEAAMKVARTALREDFRTNLGKKLRAAEWEDVIASAVKARFPAARVAKTGGPNELGADIEIEIDNPLGGASWLTVVQVKDYVGEVGSEVVMQLEQAIRTRRDATANAEKRRTVVSAVLAVTNATPSAELTAEIVRLEERSGVPVTILAGDELMELILRGIAQSPRD